METDVEMEVKKIIVNACLVIAERIPEIGLAPAVDSLTTLPLVLQGHVEPGIATTANASLSVLLT